MNTQDWSPLGWTGWISLQSKGLSRVFSNTTVQKHQFFHAHFLYSPSAYRNNKHTKASTEGNSVLFFFFFTLWKDRILFFFRFLESFFGEGKSVFRTFGVLEFQINYLHGVFYSFFTVDICCWNLNVTKL